MWLWCPSEEAKQTNRNYFVGGIAPFCPFNTYMWKASERPVQNNQLSRWMLPLPTTLAFKCRLLQGITNEQGKTRFHHVVTLRFLAQVKHPVLFFIASYYCLFNISAIAAEYYCYMSVSKNNNQCVWQMEWWKVQYLSVKVSVKSCENKPL